MDRELVSEKLWEIIEPLLPPEPSKDRGGRPRIPARAVLCGIIYVLKAGIPWRSQPISRDDDAGTRGHRVDQAEVRERAAIGEQAASFAEHQRVDLQYILVDQITPHQRLDEHAAAEDHQGLIVVLLELGDRFGGVALQ